MAKTRNCTTVSQGLCAAGMLEFFFERFDMTTVSDSELQYLSGCSEVATLKASSLASLTSDVAGLLNQHQDGAHAVSFERSSAGIDHSMLLFQLASEFKLIGQMMHIASEADWSLRQRLSDRLRLERSRRGPTDEYSSREDV